MRKSRRRHRALRAALGLAIILALGFAADAIVLMTTRAHADAADLPDAVANSQRSTATPAEASGDRSQPADRRVGVAARRYPGRASDAFPPPGQRISPGWLGSVVARDDRRHPDAGRSGWNRRRQPSVSCPSRQGVGMQVVGRVSLSTRHTVYMLRVGRRVLLVGAGPQGSPSLISELDDPGEIESEPPQGDQA